VTTETILLKPKACGLFIVIHTNPLRAIVMIFGKRGKLIYIKEKEDKK
jgi:hypothetical protein